MQYKRTIIIRGVIAGIIVSLGLFGAVFGQRAAGKTQTYYSGDAASYRNEVIAASINSGQLELFRLRDGRLERTSIVREIPGKWEKFLDVILNVEQDRLYAYVTNGTHISKYNVSDPNAPALVMRIKDNANDWFMRLSKIDGRIVSVGTKGLKVWNYDMQVINAYTNERKTNNLQMSPDGSYIFEVVTDFEGDTENDFVRVTNATTRQVIMDQPIVLTATRSRQLHYDPARQMLYIAGDRVLKQIHLPTREVRNYAHTSTEGFAVDGSSVSSYLYFSDGIGIVKIDHALNPLQWVSFQKFAIPQSWAMGFKLVSVDGKDRLVVFNNTNITVLDETLAPLASFKAEEEVVLTVAPSEPLALALNTYTIAKGRDISLAGAGFASGEEVKISFDKRGATLGAAKTVKADTAGRFRAVIAAPFDFPRGIIYSLPDRIDVRAEGIVSGRHYSTALTVTE